jgi:hypothetical protein
MHVQPGGHPIVNRPRVANQDSAGAPDCAEDLAGRVVLTQVALHMMWIGDRFAVRSGRSRKGVPQGSPDTRTRQKRTILLHKDGAVGRQFDIRGRSIICPGRASPDPGAESLPT